MHTLGARLQSTRVSPSQDLVSNKHSVENLNQFLGFLPVEHCFLLLNTISPLDLISTSPYLQR